MLIGDYDFGALCMPSLPWDNKERKMQFFSKDEQMPILVAALMGLQHAFAMVGGLITPPLVVMKFSVAFPDVGLQQYAVAAALIVSGICTIINCVQIPIAKGYVLGTGVLSVIGTSFTMLPIFENSIAYMKAEGTDPADAYGKMLGTVMVCSLLELVLSFVPPQTLKKLFPPVVSGVCICLIGVALTGTGMRNWGGGAVCADMTWMQHKHAVAFEAAHPKGWKFGSKGIDFDYTPGWGCSGNGEVTLGFGSPEYLGLGFSVLFMLVLIECFGSPFMKNTNVVLSLVFGYIIAAGSEKDGLNYVTDDKIDAAEDITFLWRETFNIGFYGPAVFPLLIAFIVTTVETIGDVGATYDASGEERDTEEYNKSVQGGLLSDAICSFFSAICTSMPNTTFSQNNGVIALTKCASRRAGVATGCWLIFMGVFAKISGIITSIPDCVLGGMTIFLFSNVVVSGISVLSKVDLSSRRNRFILALSLGIGIGVTVVPHVASDFRGSGLTANIWPCTDCDKAERSVRNGILIFLSTGYCSGTVIALFLNLILPTDPIIVSKGKDEPAVPKAADVDSHAQV